MLRSFRKNACFLFLCMVLLFTMSGCGGGDTAMYGGVTAKTVEIEGKIQTQSPAAPINSINNSAGGALADSAAQNSVLALDAASGAVIGNGIVSGDSYIVNITTGANAVIAKIVIKNNRQNSILYQCVLGKIPASPEIPDKVKKIKLSGIDINENSTARALLAFEKKINLLSIISEATLEVQAAGEALNLNYEGKTTPADVRIETACGGASVVFELAKAVKTVSVISLSNISENVKASIISTNISSVSDLLKTFVAAVKNSEAQGVIAQNQLSSSITLSGTT
ncbi:MAG TPA: hypothetical protein PK467_14285, partial [Candidatus Wallbacteria bacterium]|nr:hypothetical protein [Candidatus Wallbacteria bacterium]